MDAAELQAELAAERIALRWSVTWTVLTGVGLAGGLIAGWTGLEALVPWAYGLAFVAGGGPAGIEALRALRRGKLEIDLLMVLAALAAAAVGAPRDGAILLFLFSLASTLEERAMGTTRRAVAALMSLRPDTAHVLENGDREVDRPAEEVPVGALVRVRPGERVPLDGVVDGGASAVDQAPITGESVPVDKVAGDEVFAGTVNGHGALVVRVTKAASDSTLARMVRLVTEAQAAKAPSERFSDWFGQRYTVFVLVGTAVALGAFFAFGLPAAEAFYRAATLLVVASPCAVVISVPAAVLSALAAGARRGVLFKGGGALEALAEIDGIAFDKTGTLTRGVMRVVDLAPLAVDEEDLLRVAAALETASEHPIARAVVAHAEELGIEPFDAIDVQARPGHGVTGQVNGYRAWAGNRRLARAEGMDLDAEGDAHAALVALEDAGRTVVVVADHGGAGGAWRLLGLIGVADTPRPHAAEAIADLRRAGVGRVAVLTGDHAVVAHAVAVDLGLADEDVHADLLPEDKVARVRTLAEAGPVAFVGDGVNDAGALATAGVGIAMGAAGSDVALETADIALLSDDLRRLGEAVRLAQATKRVIRQNLGFALGIMAVMVVATLVGRLPLPLGVVGHEGGTLLVVANGLRLLGRGRAPKS
jgi:heavy metal translocating P-type ATPase